MGARTSSSSTGKRQPTTSFVYRSAKTGRLIDEGRIKTTVAHHLGTINAENQIKAHAMLESQQAHGRFLLKEF